MQNFGECLVLGYVVHVIVIHLINYQWFHNQLSTLCYYELDRFVRPLTEMSYAVLSGDKSDHENGMNPRHSVTTLPSSFSFSVHDS